MTVSEKIEGLFRGLEKRENIYAQIESIFGKDYTKSFYLPVYRLLICYKNSEVRDFLSNLRQVLLYTHRKLLLPEKAINWCRKFANEYSLSVDIESGAVEARVYAMENDENLKYSFDFLKRRKHKDSISDSALYNFFGYESYISLQQKCMIYTLKQIEKGGTFLACLPTGSGKSLTWQLAVARGQFTGVTVVVVPTVALALDHRKNDIQTLKKLPWVESIAYSSKEYGNHPEKMQLLKKKIENGKNFILYISPEGLTNYEIATSLNESAKKKNISAIVIDETHLVIDWGMNFRPEFQFLPAMISKLKELSDNTITTVLLSATITEKDRETLYSLFGEKGITEFRGDELRPEIEYYARYCRLDNDRNQIISELIKTVPRPAIVYVGTVEQSEKIFNIIKETGINRVELFNSEISDVNKDILLEKWKKDEIDIMVATSAFGMGVDKSDVRTIITAYMPENISRFYQEVGRAGRDGYSALNFILYCPEADSGVVSHFTDSKVISADNLAKRWIAMLNNHITETENIESNCTWIDTDTAPEHLEFSVTGGKNSGWNEDAISMLTRASLIKILDIRRQYKGNHKSFKIKVQLMENYINILESQNMLENFISEYRDKERQDINEEKMLIREMLSSKNEMCYSEYFMREFVFTKMACVGCPCCRKNEYSEIVVPGVMELYMEENIRKGEIQFMNSVSHSINADSFGYFSYENELTPEILNKLVIRLLVSGARIIVFESNPKLDIQKLRMIPNDNYLLLTASEWSQIPDNLIYGTIVFVINNMQEDFKLLREAKTTERRDSCNVIIVAPEGYYDSEEGRYLSDYTEYGKKMTIMLQEDVIC